MSPSAVSKLPAVPPAQPRRPERHNISSATGRTELGGVVYHILKGYVPLMTVDTAEAAHRHLKVATPNPYRLTVK